ncbi:sigma-54-dependent transcriptional regulator [Glaciecola sp. 1036]|uniref:sigma-54-dependent transcriptional regulator n=1 Tax=Alteromonadaceae TaxID=72275 RepID=UPI003D08F8B5
MKSILVVDDDPEFNTIMGKLLEHLGHHPSISDSVADAKEWLDLNEFDHVFIDFMLPDGSGLHVYEHLKTKSKLPKVTFITGNPKIKKTISELVGPNVDYLMKPIQREDIELVLSSKSKKSKKTTEKTELHFGCLIGESAPMQKLYTMIERVAQSDANVMLMGESGAGKELVAHAIHNASQPEGDLIFTNCGGFSKELIGSELFGHEKGAFTGAVGQKRGVFERANKGTLFLDEVTEMPIDMQPNLLRVLETNRLTRVGGTQEISVNCRVVSATNRDLQSIAEDNVLREDIYFRLAVFPIEIPPLRSRIEDIPLLANAFVEELNRQHDQAYKLSKSQLTMLQNYGWPGNVRELRHAIHRAFILSDPGSKELQFPENFESPFASVKSKQPKGIEAGRTIEDVEKSLIYATLKEVDGNKSMAADMLGISTKTLYNRLHAYGEDI